MKTQDERFEELYQNRTKFFQFMKERYPLFLNSNVFLRDIQYAISTYFERKNILLSYPEAEDLMTKLTTVLEKQGELVRLNYNSWKVNFSL